MKLIKAYCISAILLQALSSFGQETPLLKKIDSTECKLVKIDSIGNFYLLNFQEKNNQYKIVSRKTGNTCANLHTGNTYRLNLVAMWPKTMNYLDVNHHIGGGICIQIDWGTNLYEAQEICGLCYETDSLKLKNCKNIINKQNRFENGMLYIFFHYLPKNKHGEKEKTFAEFCEIQKANSIPFTLNNIKRIPINLSPATGNDPYFLFTDSLNQKLFIGKILFEYNNFYYIQGNYENDPEFELYGWIEKKFLITTK